MSTARERIADYIHGTALGYSQSAIERGSAMCDAYWNLPYVCRDCGHKGDEESRELTHGDMSDPNNAHWICSDEDACADRQDVREQAVFGPSGVQVNDDGTTSLLWPVFESTVSPAPPGPRNVTPKALP